MTELLTCAACVLTNCLVGYTGMRYMDAIGSDISAFNAAGADSPQAFDPTKAALDDEVTIVVNDAQESFGAQPGTSRLESRYLAACWHTL